MENSYLIEKTKERIAEARRAYLFAGCQYREIENLLEATGLLLQCIRELDERVCRIEEIIAPYVNDAAEFAPEECLE